MTYKILGQIVPANATNTPLYEAPTGKQAVCSTLTICNYGTYGCRFRVFVVGAVDSLTDKCNILYDVDINSNETLFFTIGITLSAGDTVGVYVDNGTVAFNLFGTEV